MFGRYSMSKLDALDSLMRDLAGHERGIHELGIRVLCRTMPKIAHARIHTNLGSASLQSLICCETTGPKDFSTSDGN